MLKVTVVLSELCCTLLTWFEPGIRNNVCHTVNFFFFLDNNENSGEINTEVNYA